MKIEVVYALPDSATCLRVEVAEGAQVEEAIIASGILEKCPQIDKDSMTVGVWNRTCKLTQILKEGDRIEIYRPLIADPKDARRKRAEKAKEEGRANKITGGKPLK
ncbi:hypothetical protein PULV_a0123 [Pseudoalteromonas ulvae UL12]|nr:hypothetical protein [Pseudoalteromonas ulvae UL12]